MFSTSIVSTLATIIISAGANMPLQAAPAPLSQVTSNTTEKPLLFVMTAGGMTMETESKTLVLTDVSNDIVWFTDRPGRDAGHMDLKQFMSLWAGRPDDFGNVPPNAVIIAAGHEQTPAVIEILQPARDGSTLTFDIEIIDGTLPPQAGEVTLVVDPFMGTVCFPGVSPNC